MLADPIFTTPNTKGNSDQINSNIDRTANPLCREFVHGMVLEKDLMAEQYLRTCLISPPLVMREYVARDVSSSIITTRQYEGFSAFTEDAYKYVHKRFSIMELDPILEHYRSEREAILSRIHFMYSEPSYPGKPVITKRKGNTTPGP